MWIDSKKCFAKMHENSNLKDRVGILVGQSKRIIIKKTLEEGGKK
jgi:hypothetical protein